MALKPGTRLGVFEVMSSLGAGGMGEVYRARDPKLGRDVAIKVLPAAFLADPERRARFEREARVLASINHPHIGAIYGVEEAEDGRALILELVEGETLDDRITTTGRLAVEDALGVARQIAEALEAAHEKGIVHRDLKPANIMINDAGAVKVLDFGLARLDTPERSGSSIANSPTLTYAGTLEGVILGTAVYLSPEQARGRVADKRTDIWAFGCVLFEMLSGQRAFGRETVTDTIAAIVHQEPEWAALPETAPDRVRHLLRRCLAKEPRRRLHDIADARIEIEEILASPVEIPRTSATSPRGTSFQRLPWILFAIASFALIVLSAIVVRWMRRDAPETTGPIKYSMVPPGAVSFSPTAQFFAVSPDGRHIAFAATSPTGVPVIWIRSQDTLEARPLAGTEGARQPFWSPDSQFVGYFAAGGMIKKVRASGGPPQTLSAALATGTGGTWNRDGVILVSAQPSAVLRLSASGGSKPVPVTPEDDLKRQFAPAFPHFLPDGKRFLYYQRSANPDEDGIYVKNLEGGEPRLVLHASSNVAYVPSGHLLYVRESVLLAHPFDPDAAKTIGDPVPIAERVEYLTETGIAAFSVSDNGVLVYRSSPNLPASRLVWMDRSGKRVDEIGDPAPYRNPRLSPDGRRVAAELIDSSGNRDIWILDPARRPMRFTFDPGRDAAPVWSSDGSKIAWQGATRMYVKSADGKGEPQPVIDQPWIPDDWLPDGSGLLGHPAAPREIFVLDPARRDRPPRKVVEGTGITTQARISPDGKWVAFANADSGRFEIAIQDFPQRSGRWQVTTTGGLQPKWRADAKELFYLTLAGQLAAVPVSLGGLVEVGKSQILFETQTETVTGYVWHQYDVSRDGQRFLVNITDAVVSPVTVVHGWPALVRERR